MSDPRAAQRSDASIIALDRFIQATRDSGYKGTNSALAELVDNSLQAKARRIAITIAGAPAGGEESIEVAVLDNGCGMDRGTLRQALRFGGSSRFNDRSGLGRYGMGLPNSSLSQARRLEVYSWQEPGVYLFSYLDVDEIASGGMTEVPAPRRLKPPAWPGECAGKTGALVVWTRCDRLDHRRISTIARKVSTTLGRVFRYAIWDGVRITVNNEPVHAVDPLYLHAKSKAVGGRLFDRPNPFEVRVPAMNGEPERTGQVVVTFSELPVHEWHELSNEEKRARGVANGSGVSVVRCGREIDYGWFFMGQKRRENYDDWWRCEVKFGPVLDEAFGITHTKQQIRPRDYLLEALSPHIEATAKALNSRVRDAHTQVKVSERVAVSEQQASEMETKLRPLPSIKVNGTTTALLHDLARRHPGLKDEPSANGNGRTQYRIVHERIKDTAFFTPVLQDGRVTMVLNPEHPFYKSLYKPLLEEDAPKPSEVRRILELLLLAAARAEAAASRSAERETISAYRTEWSRALAVYLNG
jgi:hypothetical protein